MFCFIAGNSFSFIFIPLRTKEFPLRLLDFLCMLESSINSFQDLYLNLITKQQNCLHVICFAEYLHLGIECSLLFLSLVLKQMTCLEKNRLLKAAPPWHWKPFFEKRKKNVFFVSPGSWLLYTI